MYRYQDIKDKLIAMGKTDRQIREKLLKEKSLSAGYNEEMERVHDEHAQALEKIIDTIGWPAKSKVGDEASQAAWLILLHAISRPEFQKKSVLLLRALVDEGEVEAKELAYLEDRICFFERKPQKYGTQFDWDENGELKPWQIENPQMVDELRQKMGLLPIEEQTALMRNNARRNGETPPVNYQKRMEEMEQWLRKVGWMKP